MDILKPPYIVVSKMDGQIFEAKALNSIDDPTFIFYPEKKVSVNVSEYWPIFNGDEAVYYALRHLVTVNQTPPLSKNGYCE